MSSGGPPVPPRDIPTLYPGFFTEILTTTGVPATPINIVRLADRSVAMIGNNAARMLAQARNQQVFEGLVQAFGHGGIPDRRGQLLDDMVDWLWAWAPAHRAELREPIWPRRHPGSSWPATRRHGRLAMGLGTGARAELREQFPKARTMLLGPKSFLWNAGETIPPFGSDEAHPDFEKIWRTVYRDNL